MKKEVTSITDKDKIKEDGSYLEFVFSNLISLSDSKKCILLINVIKNINYEGGKPVGDEVIFILEKEKDEWKLTNKKSVGMY